MKLILTRKDLFLVRKRVPIEDLSFDDFPALSNHVIEKCNTIVFIDNDSSIKYFKSRDLLLTYADGIMLANDISYIVERVYDICQQKH